MAEIEALHAVALERFQGTVISREEEARAVQDLRAQMAVAVGEAERLVEDVRTVDQTVARRQEELAAVQSRLRTLQGVLREEMGYGRVGEEEDTSLRAACQGVRDSVAEWLVVPPGLERAVEAILGERMRAWLVETPMQARRAVEFLNQKGLGRGAFVPMHPRYAEETSKGPSNAWWPLLQGKPGVRGRAIDLVQAGAEAQEVLASLFERVVIVSSLEVAVEQWERGLWSAPDGPTLVTIDGEVMDAAGVITGGTAGTAGGLLLRRREIQRLEEERGVLSRTLEDNRQDRARLSVQCESIRTKVQRLEEVIRDAEMRGLALTKDEAAFRDSMEDLARRLETIRTERQVDEQERIRIQEELQTVGNQVARLVEEKTLRESGLTQLQTELKTMEEESLGLQHRLTESRMSLASVRARLEHGQADWTRLQREQEERDGRANELREQLRALDLSIQQNCVERDRNVALVRNLDQRAGVTRTELVSAEQQYNRHLDASRELEEKLAAVRAALNSNRGARTSVEVRRAEVTTQLSVRESTLSGTYQLTIEAALAQEPVEARAESGGVGLEPAEDSSIVLRNQLQKIRDRLERLGPINLAAIEEHRELEERHRFLTTQEEDLSRSVSSLKEIISRINRTTKELFRETFDELQEKFGEVFGRFFPGGRAELVLTEPQPDLDSGPGSEEPGVDIAAQPPGKRLKSIAMLSGGEKTLTAMALIFASFLIRPTPFCILDEIDAPLDEENIGRFTGVLRDLSDGAQFVVITHNKQTMALADSLFGVTMEEPGISKLVSVRLADLQPA